MIDAEAESKRHLLTELIESKRLLNKNVPQALNVAEVSPSASAWQQFINTLLLWFGSLALAFGVIFFVAANWHGLGRMGKFALLEGFIIIVSLGHLVFRHNEGIRQASLLVCVLAVGALMALFGQTYQTGADPWQLFFNWAVLTTPWVIISRSSVIWLIWLALLNLSISLYYQTFGGFLNIPWVLFLFNGSALILWQLSAHKLGWLNTQWAINLIAISCGSFALMVFIESLFDDDPKGIIIWCIWAGLTFYVYRYLIFNLLILAGWSLAILVAANTLVIRLISNYFDASSFMFLTLVTLGIGTYLTIWLKSLIKADNV